ncbi:MAG TPA: hypothetical protein VJT49_00125 [Amycolatopsis sp.]|uniref:hypothetical protein n=1 Tax=Amycolatopsis sp. TaxID=37632 RepID=UPI002B49A404|nr:hypothetical protein [Amycolatopsis sp.]HKS43520.1 hypothetical protein [Amycolatopsis sp.]
MDDLALGRDAAGHTPADPVDDAALAELAAHTANSEEPGENGDREVPEVLALLAEAIDDRETGIIATAELADRIGWDAKTLGETLRRLGLPTPHPPRQRVGGSRNPVSVQDIGAIIAAIASYLDVR